MLNYSNPIQHPRSNFVAYRTPKMAAVMLEGDIVYRDRQQRHFREECCVGELQGRGTIGSKQPFLDGAIGGGELLTLGGFAR